jgi:hypothetical protein
MFRLLISQHCPRQLLKVVPRPEEGQVGIALNTELAGRLLAVIEDASRVRKLAHFLLSSSERVKKRK